MLIEAVNSKNNIEMICKKKKKKDRFFDYMFADSGDILVIL